MNYNEYMPGNESWLESDLSSVAYLYMIDSAERYLKGMEDGPDVDLVLGVYSGEEREEIRVAVESGMKQIEQKKGCSKSTAFEDLGVSGFSSMMLSMGFRLGKQVLVERVADAFIDQMHMVYDATEDEIVLYNKVVEFNPYR